MSFLYFTGQFEQTSKKYGTFFSKQQASIFKFSHEMKKAIWHIFAIFTIIVWGGSFVSTKVLLLHDFSAVHIFALRFIVVYFLLALLSHKHLFAKSKKDELTLAIGGLSGCTLYYFTENTALAHSFASNVSLIVCSNPLLIMIAMSILYKSERLGKRQILGSLLTLVGMILVVLNGKFILKISPFGDMLAFGAAIVWTIYSLMLRRLNGKYDVLFVNRKIFFYGTLTSIPILLLDKTPIPWSNFAEPAVWGNFAFLGIIASLAGYIVWTKVLEKLGTVFASNYIYAIPLVTIIISVFVLSERITPIAICGAIGIVVGMILAEKR